MGGRYFWDHVTARSSWHPPPPQLGFWERLLDFRTGRPYFVHRPTQLTRWELPLPRVEAPVVPVPPPQMTPPVAPHVAPTAPASPGGPKPSAVAIPTPATPPKAAAKIAPSRRPEGAIQAKQRLEEIKARRRGPSRSIPDDVTALDSMIDGDTAVDAMIDDKTALDAMIQAAADYSMEVLPEEPPPPELEDPYPDPQEFQDVFDGDFEGEFDPGEQEGFGVEELRLLDEYQELPEMEAELQALEAERCADFLNAPFAERSDEGEPKWEEPEAFEHQSCADFLNRYGHERPAGASVR
ncbi:unnamed protein product, partial [Effrenium voratum]